MSEKLPDLIAHADAAEILGIHPRTLDRLIERGQGPARVRLGRRVFYRAETLAAWVAGCEA